MKTKACILAVVGLMLLAVSAASENSVTMKVSGPGVVNDSTLKVGEKVTFEIYTTTEKKRTGFTLGFALKSDDIKSVIHVADSGNGLNANGDIKGYEGWQDKSVWDLAGVFAVERDWDGQVPELIGFGGISVKMGYLEELEPTKKLTFDIIVPEAGTLVVDSSFFPPGGGWYYSAPKHVELLTSPKWDGPHVFKVK
ncbi:MAG: hypothetical protein KAT79_06915 [candidate division Zixibacteria bacterium]|nr:hypothetical protein [candidate division Zixibacteria bacterium]